MSKNRVEQIIKSNGSNDSSAAIINLLCMVGLAGLNGREIDAVSEYANGGGHLCRILAEYNDGDSGF